MCARMCSGPTQFDLSLVLCTSSAPTDLMYIQTPAASGASGRHDLSAKGLAIKIASYCSTGVQQPCPVPRQNSHRCQRFYFHQEITKRCGFWNIIDIKTTAWAVLSLLLSRKTLRGDSQCKALFFFRFVHWMAELLSALLILPAVLWPFTQHRGEKSLRGRDNVVQAHRSC